jgi:hypothetical protein
MNELEMIELCENILKFAEAIGMKRISLRTSTLKLILERLKQTTSDNA